MSNFYVFEGLDGSGKSTQAELLFSYLMSQGKKVWLTKEPTDSEKGKELRALLKDQNLLKIDPNTLIDLYDRDRKDHIKDIFYHLSKGEDVICDRYWYSTYAYQGNTKDLKKKIIDLSKDYPRPDYLFYIDVPVEECIRRINGRGLLLEAFEKKEILKKVSHSYQDYFLLLNHKPYIIDGKNDSKEVFSQIKEILK
jgi:dTMP kinase